MQYPHNSRGQHVVGCGDARGHLWRPRSTGGGRGHVTDPTALTDPGPQDPSLAGNEPAFQNPPPTDVNGMPQFWTSFNLAPLRLRSRPERANSGRSLTVQKNDRRPRALSERLPNHHSVMFDTRPPRAFQAGAGRLHQPPAVYGEPPAVSRSKRAVRGSLTILRACSGVRRGRRGLRVGSTSLLWLSNRVVEALAESYLQRVACVLLPKPDPVGIRGVNALEDVGVNAGAILLERSDEVGGLYEHFLALSTCKAGDNTGAVSAQTPAIPLI
jgi:hypothetical protein